MDSCMSLPVGNTRRVMSEWPNWWILRLLQTTIWGVETACSFNGPCLCLWLLATARVHRGFEISLQAYGFGIGFSRFSRLLRWVEELAILVVGLDTTWYVESVCKVLPWAGVIGTSVVVGESIEHCCVAAGVEVICWVITAMCEFFSKDEWAESWAWIVEANGLLRLWNSQLERNLPC